ncbi:ABC transporter ATP-binding protein [uncultured Roseivirga sp.]|uniref:ABC transporter ATP-binding protein n=1 Tax=uncultured Roseivirga sp. TaxID=543088 RepID=UPI0030D7C5E0|tara:strand:- start:30162 stop:30797 length:636 start_codon:yes stop_codon:yes gene_type:complete
MITIENLNFGYSEKRILTVPHMEIKEKQHLMILGKSGSGKTTLLHILGGLLKPVEGKVIIDETNLYQLSGSEMDKYRGQNIGLVFQKAHLVSALTVKDNLLLAQYFSGIPQDKARIKEVLETLNLGEKLNSKVRQLSQGEQQRVTIARALLNKPRVILADEPTASLDDDNANSVIQLLKEQAESNNASLIIATHDQRVKDAFDLQLNLNEQ